MALLRIQRETDDWIPRTLIKQGSTYTGDWSYQIVAYEARPVGTWLPAVEIAGVKGIEVSGLNGLYEVFYRPDGQGSYVPVLDPDRILAS
jgi:hypothetical protein